MKNLFFYIAEIIPFLFFLFLIIFAITNRYIQNKKPKTNLAKQLKTINKHLEIIVLAFCLFAFAYGMFIMFNVLG